MDKNYKKTLLIVLITFLLTSLYFVTAIVCYQTGKKAGRHSVTAKETGSVTNTDNPVADQKTSNETVSGIVTGQSKHPSETVSNPMANSSAEQMPEQVEEHNEKTYTTDQNVPSSEYSDTIANAQTGTPLARHGKLYVNGIDLMDEYHQRFQLKGVSTHGLQWYPEYINYESFKTLRDDWSANVVRLAMYTGEGGYMTGGNQAQLESKIDDGVSYCTQLGMYCIIDWHILSDGNPNQYKEGAKEFFRKMSEKYKNHTNILYEICNEPNGGVSWSEVKSYADEIISVIRANDSDAIIIVGTPTWSQDVDVVAANPVANPHNVMYAFHFYAATHKDYLRNKVMTARNNQTPVIISEFSICEASGSGSIDYDSARQWSDFIDNNNLSYIGWNLSNKNELSALISPNCLKTSGWSIDELSETGKWLRKKIRDDFP